MSATKLPNQDPPTTAPISRKSWVYEAGERREDTWAGDRASLEAKYEALKVQAQVPGENIGELELANTNGRATLVCRYGRTSDVSGSDITIIEELYAVDVLVDIRRAPYWDAMSDDEMAVVNQAFENQWTEDEIDANSEIPWTTSWTDLMKNLRYHLVHGVDTYFETGFVLRRSSHGVRTSQIKGSFANINDVVSTPDFTTPMDSLIAAMPTGEWLKKPIECEHLGRGRWRVTEEYHWAEKWSVVYGGTWGWTAP